MPSFDLIGKKGRDSREEGGEVRPDRDIEDEEIHETTRSGKFSTSFYFFIF